MCAINKWQYLPRDLWFFKWNASANLAFGRLRTSSEDFGLLQKTSDFFGSLRKWSCRLQKSQHSQDKNLTLISQKKLAGIITYRYIFNAVPLGSVPELPATSCHEINANEGKRMDDGTYWMLLSGKIVRAFCNMTSQPEGTFCSSSVRPEFIRSIIGWGWIMWYEELCRSAASIDNAMQELHYCILHIIRKSNPIIVLWLNLKCFIFSP